jgi:hypothetical protein
LIRSETPRSFWLAIGGVEKRLAVHCMFRQGCKAYLHLYYTCDVCIGSPIFVSNGVNEGLNMICASFEKEVWLCFPAGSSKMNREPSLRETRGVLQCL